MTKHSGQTVHTIKVLDHRTCAKVAERSQRLMFNATNLFFHKAVFKVPSNKEEALQVMRQGTEDVDKDGGPDSDLYILSWSHTQFLSAQMAALGYR